MAQSLPDPYHDERRGDPPFLTESGWRPLLDGRDLAGWHAEGGAAHDWFTTPGVPWRRAFSPARLTAKAGVFLHGLYAVQIFDSFGLDGPLTVGDAGGVYELPRGGGGSPQALNAARPPGESQSLRIWFQAPQFDSAGKLMAKPKIPRVVLKDVHAAGRSRPGRVPQHLHQTPGVNRCRRCNRTAATATMAAE